MNELTTDKRYQISIPVHPKDYTKIPFVIERALRFSDATAIHLLAYETKDILKYIPSDSRVHLHHERDILPEPRDIFPDIRQGQGWYFQQFLELFQDVTDTDWYIGLDCDLLFNKPYPVFSPNGQPVQVLSRDKYSQIKIYSGFSKAMFRKIIPEYDPQYNYLSDGTLYNKRITRQMASDLGYTVGEFMQQAAKTIAPKHTPGDANLYMYYVDKIYPPLYRKVDLFNAMNGKYNGQSWSAEDISKLIAQNPHADTISAHCWGMVK